MQNTSSTHKLELLLNIASFLSIFQFYVIRLGGVYLQVYMVFMYWMLLSTFGKRKGWTGIEAFAAALIAFQAISIVWAKNPGTGIREIFFLLPFLIALRAAVELATQDPAALRRAAIMYLKIAAVHSALIIIGRVAPPAKIAFLNSPLSSIFINPNTLNDTNVYLTGSNIRDPGKSGGFLINANVAGAWSLLTFHLAAALYFVDRQSILKWLALIHFLAAICCGSKLSLLCIPVGFMFSLAFVSTSMGPDPLKRAAIAVLGCFSISAASLAIYASGILAHTPYRLVAPFEARMVTWGFGAKEFFKSPLLGHGYGGWTESFSRSGEVRLDLGLTQFSAPQNTFIQLWSQSGIIAAAIGIIFVSATICTISRIRATPSRAAPFFLASGVFCFFFQGMAENYGLFGETHIQQLLVLTLAVIISLSIPANKAGSTYLSEENRTEGKKMHANETRPAV